MRAKPDHTADPTPAPPPPAPDVPTSECWPPAWSAADRTEAEENLATFVRILLEWTADERATDPRAPGEEDPHDPS